MTRDYVLQPFRAPVDLEIDYERELNPQQLAAVTAEPGPALVLAGAGAGKTRTLVYRVAYLLEQGVTPDSILLLTFTNKAAREMMRRVADLLGKDVGALWGGTFHAVGNRVLRRHADLLGYGKGFTILDREDARDVISACLGEAEIDPKTTLIPKADVLGDLFSLAANTGQPLPQLLERQFENFAALAPRIADLQQRYTERKRASNVMDFDDLLVLWLRLIQEHSAVREHYQRRFRFILVDEYQDTNRLQSDLVDLLAAEHHNVMAVGDDSQSIYSWRGANFHNILRFPERHPGAAIYRIETNYRSTPEILTVANAAIAANVHQYDKRLAPVRPGGLKPGLVVCADAQVQATFVAQRILELHEEGVALNDIAILYRAHFHALELQLELTRRGLPFSITSGIRFFEQAHVKDVAAYLKLVCNPRDELAFKRLARMLPGVGPKAADKLWTSFQPRPAAAEAVAPALAAALQGLAPVVPKKCQALWAQFTTTVSQLESDPVRQNAAAMIRLILEAVYQDYLNQTFTNSNARLEDLEQLIVFADRFPSPEEFLAQLALMTDVEAEAESSAAREARLRLSTVHQAKGLEFGIVFVIMLCDGLFPSARSLKDQESEEEERRLFYVAVTRAKNELYLSYPLMRAAGAYGAPMHQQPSRFLKEIPVELLEEWRLQMPSQFW